MNEYQKKRNFDKTPEPKNNGTDDNKRKGNDDKDAHDKNANKKASRLFVVQEHAASSHHYDFRIEIDKKLKSWAIPKGPSLNPSTKRLAVLTEDHPVSYAEFEGTIPEGEYGAGKVLIWDRGEYENSRKLNMPTSFRQGKIEIVLKGKRLKGKFALVRTQLKSKKSRRNHWLLIKVKDDYADAKMDITKSQPESIESHKKIDEI